MTAARVADFVGAAAFALLTVGCLLDLRMNFKEGKASAGQTGLPWIRLGTLGLWVGIAVRMGLDPGGQGPVAWLTLVPALAFTLQLHLLHVPGWKGAPIRRVGPICWLIALAAFGLLLLGRN